MEEVQCVQEPCQPQPVCRDGKYFFIFPKFLEKISRSSCNHFTFAQSPDFMIYKIVATVVRDEIRRGRCPAVDPNAIGVCVEQCGADSDCLGTQKCCSNGCGTYCTEPIQPGM